MFHNVAPAENKCIMTGVTSLLGQRTIRVRPRHSDVSRAVRWSDNCRLALLYDVLVTADVLSTLVRREI